MLRPAHIGHLALLRSLIREAARDGAFDAELARESPAADRFFTELRQALKTGYFVVNDAKTGTLQTVAVPGYVYWADDEAGGAPPVGFGLFRAVDDGYELWLAGLEASLRGRGHGRAMLDWIGERAAAEGIPRVYLDSRATAKGFYERAGFTFLTSIPCWKETSSSG